MQFQVRKDEFLEALNKVQGVVEKKNVMPILANVLLEAEGPVLRISATDLEVAIQVLVQAKIDKPGKITLSARKLYDIVKEAGSEAILVKLVDQNRVEITSGKSVSKLMALPANEFPKLPEVEGAFVKQGADVFLKNLYRVAFAMSNDETRYHLNGIYFCNENETLNIVATDGHRLSIEKVPSFLENLPERGIIVPRKGINEIRKLLAGEKTFEIAVGKKHLFLRSEKQMLSVRLIDGEFPNYKRVIPEKSQIHVRVPREELIGAVRRVSLLSDEYSHGVKLFFSNNSLLVNTSNIELGEAKEEVPLAYKANPVEISFNSRYVLDVLGAIDDELVDFHFNDSASPCLMASESHKSFSAVVMPMRT